ncbi:hypothetical protein J7T55_015062 [Diaporthe amygdali]|uniref:uncharacterized protein n=1 Tax=Phomopsis amygdali TaxID=1214568 RepID=UPI0022FDB870|nr:uncharacterized protein J7T55_015062 [Diaporthe amygdali]KAJ0108628.1 hypothetical protein J7T55_015062 [Diaporthe amygdali]
MVTMTSNSSANSSTSRQALKSRSSESPEPIMNRVSKTLAAGQRKSRVLFNAAHPMSMSGSPILKPLAA